MSNLQHEFHADPVFYQPHHEVSLTLEHLVVLPGQCVGVLDGEVKVGSWTEEKNVGSVSHAIMIQKMTHYTSNVTTKFKRITCPSLCLH